MGERILLVDDEPSLVATLSYALGRAGYSVRSAGTGPAAIAAARESPPDLILLDVMLPGLDGFEVCRRLRGETNAPIVMLTARDEPIDRVVGLEVGADDYVAKPFSTKELIARVHAHLRRAAMLRGEHAPIASVGPSEPPGESRIAVGRLVIDVGRRHAALSDRTLPLKRREFDLLAYLARNAGVVLSRRRLVEEVWLDEVDADTRTIDVHVRRLRRHVERDPRTPEYPHTVRGTGYTLRHRPRP